MFKIAPYQISSRYMYTYPDFKYFVIYVISTCLSCRIFAAFIPLFLGILLILVYSPVHILLLLKLRCSSLKHRWLWPILTILFRPSGLFASNDFLNYLSFKYSGFERTWWRLFQKHVVSTKCVVYVRFHCFNLIVNSVTVLLEGWIRNP